MPRVLRNVLGSFSDGAILFPLIAAICAATGESSAKLFLSTGLMYLFSAWYFRVPMSVQPLKAIAIAAVVSGASFLEIRVAGGLLGALCLMLLFFPLERWVQNIPKYVVHGIQLGLGLMLMKRGIEILYPKLTAHMNGETLYFIIGFLAVVVVGHFFKLSVLGLIAAAGVVLGLKQTDPSSVPSITVKQPIHWGQVVGLVLPQLVLTGTNSVIATVDVAHRYFGKRASRLTVRALLTSIGLGNLGVAWLGGLPFCHGSGGVTAHVRGGSDHGFSNGVIGLFLLSLALVQMLGSHVILEYPPVLMGVMLFMVGVYHALLAQPAWENKHVRLGLAVMAAVSAFTGNLLLGVAIGVSVQKTKELLILRRVKHDCV